MEIKKFSPAKAEIQAVILEVEGLTISGVDDEASYEAVKVGKKKLAEMRIKITKFGKEQREEAIKWQKEVLRQEKELVGMIDPEETRLKSEMERIDEEKKRKEREILLPARIKMLEKVGVKLLDAEILAMDETSFSSYFTEKKMQYLEMQENKRKQEEEANRRSEELEQAKKEAAEMAVKQEKDRAARAEQERLDNEKYEKEKAEREAEKKAAEEKAELEKTEKNRKYKAWLKSHGYTEELRQSGEMHIIRDGNTFTLYKKIDSITI